MGPIYFKKKKKNAIYMYGYFQVQILSRHKKITVVWLLGVSLSLYCKTWVKMSMLEFCRKIFTEKDGRVGAFAWPCDGFVCF